MVPRHDSGSAAVALRMGLMLALGLVLLMRVLQSMDDRASRPPRQALADARAAVADAEAMAAAGTAPVAMPASTPMAEPPERVADAPAPTAPRKPPAPSRLVEDLDATDSHVRASALSQLRSFESTPELQAALASAATRAEMSWERERIACLRLRDRSLPLGRLFDALASTPPQDAAWRRASVTCLNEAITLRADEDPARVAPILARSAMASPQQAAFDVLMRLEPQPLPPAVVAGLSRGNLSARRETAIRTAVALGAAQTAAAVLAQCLDDPDPEIRLTTIRALAARHDQASQAAAARALSAEPGSSELESLALSLLQSGDAFDRHLALVVDDTTNPSFVRAQAVYLIGRGGSEVVARPLVARPSDDATLKPELEAAARRVAERFGPARGAVR
jgi:hypothetical protein